MTGQWNVLLNSSMAQRCKLELESFYSCSNAIFPKLNNWVEENITMIHQSALQRKTMVFENCQSEFPQTRETWKHDLLLLSLLSGFFFFNNSTVANLCNSSKLQLLSQCKASKELITSTDSLIFSTSFSCQALDEWKKLFFHSTKAWLNKFTHIRLTFWGNTHGSLAWSYISSI